MLVLPHKFIDPDKELLDSKGHKVYLQYKFGDYITRFLLNEGIGNVKFTTEKIEKKTKLKGSQIHVVS